MVEVEIKARIEDLGLVRDKILSMGANFISSKFQVDRVFGQNNLLDKELKIVEGNFSARIRQEGDRINLEFKQIMRESNGAIEIVSELNEVREGIIFLSKIGFEEAFNIIKKREIFELDGFEICLDEVEELGNFIEVEKIVSADESRNTFEKAKAILNRISESLVIETKKYGDLMQEKLNNEK